MKKLLCGITLFVFCSFAQADYEPPSDNRYQINIVMAKITALLQANKEAEALPYFAQLETLDTHLPESFYFYYIDAVDKSGDSEWALSRSEAYLNKYGKNGKYYGKVIPIMSRSLMAHDKKEKEKAAEDTKKAKQYSEANNRYQASMTTCINGFNLELENTKKRMDWASDKCDAEQRRGPTSVPAICDSAVDARYKLARMIGKSSESWCNSQYQKPASP